MPNSSSGQDDPGLGGKFAQLQADYLEQARGYVSELRDLLAAGSPDCSPESHFRRLAHNLRGSGGGYGFPGISERAEALEDAILRGDEVESLSRLLESLSEEVVRSSTGV